MADKRKLITVVIAVVLLILVVSLYIQMDGDEEGPEETIPKELIQPSDLVYQGAFRLPDGDGTNERSWDHKCNS